MSTLLVQLLLLAPAMQQTERLNLDDAGAQTPEGAGGKAAQSRNGRHVAFASDSPGLDASPPDTNGMNDVFVRDRVLGRTVRISLSDGGVEANLHAVHPAISADGRFIAYDSKATSLVAPPANGERQIFVHDRDADLDQRFDEPGEVRTVLISRNDAGVQGNGDSALPSISADGRYVAFESRANQLVPFDHNDLKDVFVHDRDADGNGVFDEPGNVRTMRAVDGLEPNGASRSARIAAEARVVVFQTEATTFAADATAFMDVVIWDFSLPLNPRFSLASVTDAGQQAFGDSFEAVVSADGRIVAFSSLAGNLSGLDAPHLIDVFWHDRDPDGDGILDEPGAMTNLLVTRTPAGTGSLGLHNAPELSDDGFTVNFMSSASDLVPGDGNGERDVFVYSIDRDALVRASVATNGAEANRSSSEGGISGNGRHVVFLSLSTNLDPPDANGTVNDLYARDCPFPTPALPYCTGKTNSAGCVPFIGTEGCASATSLGPFWIEARDTVPNQPGFLLYAASRADLVYHGGKLCVRAPFIRLPPTLSKSSSGGCSKGILREDFNARIRSGADPMLTSGHVVHAQWIQRDPLDPAGFGDALTSAVRFALEP